MACARGMGALIVALGLVGTAAQAVELVRSGSFYTGTAIASDPALLRRGDQLWMAYTDLDLSTGRTVIAQVRARDGRNWQPVAAPRGTVRGLTVAGQPGTAAENVESPALLAVGDEVWLYFAGYRDQGTLAKGFPSALWRARSRDGVTFVRDPEGPVLSPSAGGGDPDAVYSPTVVVEDGVFHMVYAGHAYSDLTGTGGVAGVFLLSARSADGVAWEKAAAPIAGPGLPEPDWMRDGAAEPYLLKAPDGRYLLFFTGLRGEERTIGLATAPGIGGPWTFRAAPLLTRGPDDAPDGHQVLAPAALIEGGRLRLWYLGSSRDGALAIGTADGPWPGILD